MPELTIREVCSRAGKARWKGVSKKERSDYARKISLLAAERRSLKAKLKRKNLSTGKPKTALDTTKHA